jgi:hypothetical protein
MADSDGTDVQRMWGNNFFDFSSLSGWRRAGTSTSLKFVKAGAQATSRARRVDVRNGRTSEARPPVPV